MNKKISFALFLALILLFSIGFINASDADAVNDTVANSNDSIDFQLDDVQLEENDLDNLPDFNNTADIKNETQLKSQTTSMYYNGNYKVTLIDSATNATLANKTVYLSVNNVAYSASTNSNGVASFNLKLNPGSYLATAYFTGDDSFELSDDLSGQLKVLASIKANDVTKYYMGSKKYRAIYLDSLGKPLKNKKVTITVNGKKYTQKTDSKGLAKFTIDFKPGTYKVTTTNPSTKQAVTTTFKILKTVTSSDFRKVKGDSNNFIAKFYKKDGSALAKTYVKVKINGKSYIFKTNSNGKLKLSLNSFKRGTYKVTCYNPDGLSATSTVKIYNIATTKLTTYQYTFLPNDTHKIKIKFSTNLNDNSKSAKSIKITLNGVTYSKKTNADGEIYFKLPSLKANVYKVQCSYGGNKFFKSSYSDNYVTVLGTSDTELSVVGSSSFGNFAGTPLKVKYSAGGVPLIKKTVLFTIDNASYGATTNLKGIASIPINFDVGNYTVDLKTSGDTKVKGGSASYPIEVFERTNSTFSCEFKSAYTDESQTLKIRLTDVNGTPIAYEDIVMVVADETFYGQTNAKGYVTFKMNIAVGKYTLLLTFKGNNNYKPATVSKSINVKISKYVNGINEKKAIASSDYLKSSKNCQVGNSKIKSLVKSLTKGLTSDLDKARAIFNYVRDYIDYSYYYDSKKGAVKTLTSGYANCVDQAHLLVAMYRTAGFKARYVHGICKFYDTGKYYGHVWTQVLIGDTWICGDPIDSGNKLGKITNWNTNNYKLRSKYLSLPF